MCVSKYVHVCLLASKDRFDTKLKTLHAFNYSRSDH